MRSLQSFQTLYLFRWKIIYIDSFPHFSVFGSTQKKKQSTENYLQSMENPNKNKGYFLLDVFQFFFLWKTISLSHITSPINIIFFFTLYSLGNRIYFGAYSLTISPTLPCTCNVSFLSTKTPFYSLLSVSLTIYIYSNFMFL